MKPAIPDDFLRRLIAVGASDDFQALSRLFTDYPPSSVGHLMRQGPEYWFNLADSLPENQLEALVRAMTIAERDYPSFGGGSVTGTIWTFRRLQERSHSHLDTLADWVLAHTNNPWVPFGSNNHGARSLAALYAYRQRDTEARVDRARKENDRQAAEAIRISNKATHDIFAAIRRKDLKAIHALLHRGACIDVADEAGITALAYARTLGHVPVIKLLETHNVQLPPGM